MVACTFCRIVADEPDEHVHADEHTVAFLDTSPLFPGHLLVVPRRHVVRLDDVEPAELEPLFTTVQQAMRTLATELGAPGAFVANNNTVSQSVLHLHVHVVPRRPKDGLRGFFWPRTRYAEGEREAMRDRLRAAWPAQRRGSGPGEPAAPG